MHKSLHLEKDLKLNAKLFYTTGKSKIPSGETQDKKREANVTEKRKRTDGLTGQGFPTSTVACHSPSHEYT